MILVCNRMCTGKSQDGRLMQLKPGDHIQIVKKVKQGFLVKKKDIILMVASSDIKYMTPFIRDKVNCDV